MSDSIEKRDGRDLAVTAVGQVFAAVLGLAVGPIGAVVGAAVGPYAVRMTELAAAEWTSKSNVVADAALEASGLSGPQEFCDILSESRELNALAQRILLAAYLSGYEDLDHRRSKQ